MNKVAIYDSEFRQVLTTSSPMRVSVKPTATVFSHTLENGARINDHKIINPAEVEVQMILPRGEYQSIYQEIKQLFTSDQTMIVQTLADSFRNMVLESIPHDESGSMADTIVVNLKFVEAVFVTAIYGPMPIGSVANPNQSSTINRGEQLPTDGGNPRGSFLYRKFFSNADSTN